LVHAGDFGKFGRPRNSSPLKKGLDKWLGFGKAIAEPGAVAGDEDEAALHRPRRVLEAEGGVEVVVEPGQVEEVALLRALRLVGQLVEEVVEAAERVAETVDGLLEGRRAFGGMRQRGADLTGEGPDLVANRSSA
jgi:hypothetical protein